MAPDIRLQSPPRGEATKAPQAREARLRRLAILGWLLP